MDERDITEDAWLDEMVAQAPALTPSSRDRFRHVLKAAGPVEGVA